MVFWFAFRISNGYSGWETLRASGFGCGEVPMAA